MLNTPSTSADQRRENQGMTPLEEPSAAETVDNAQQKQRSRTKQIIGKKGGDDRCTPEHR